MDEFFVEEKRVVVKQNPIASRVMAVVISLIWIGFAIAMLIVAEIENVFWIAISFFILGALFIFYAIAAKLFIRAEEIYTEMGMVCRRGKKILYDVEWTNVARVTYNKVSLFTIFSLFGATAFMIHRIELPTDKRQPKLFVAHYSKNELDKIQSIIPIEIEYVY